MPSKKIVLYYPYFNVLTQEKDRLWHRFPYSLWALVPGLAETGFDVCVFDARVDNIADFHEVMKENPLFVGISSLTGGQLKDAMAISKWVKEHNPNTPVVWGGWHVTTCEESIKEPFIDHIITGRAEESIVDFARTLYSELTPPEIIHSGITVPFKRLPLEDIDFNKYGSIWGYITSDGCIFKCSFCAVGNLYKRTVVYKPMDQVIDELRYVVGTYRGTTGGIRQIQIDDTLFFVDKKRVEEFCRKWNFYNNVPLEALVNVNVINKYTDAQWNMLYEGGFRRLLVGAESANRIILDRVNKKFQTPEKILEFAATSAKHQIGIELSTMTGFWDSDELNDFEDTVRLLSQAWELNPNTHLQMFWIHPYPGTPMYTEFASRGYYLPRTMKEWSDYNLRRAPHWVGSELEEQMNFFINQFYPFIIQARIRWDWETFRKMFEDNRRRNNIIINRGD